MLSRAIIVGATALFAACATVGFTPIETTLEAAQAEWVEKYGNDLALAGPRAVPPIPIRIIPADEREYNAPEAVARRARLCEERGPEVYPWCE